MDPRTFVPRGDTAQLRALRDVLNAALADGAAGPVEPVRGAAPPEVGRDAGPDTHPQGDLRIVIGAQTHVLGPQVCQAVRLVVTALADGRPVTVAPQEHLVTPHEAAELLQITRRQLDEFVHLGEIPFRTVGRHHRFLMGDVLAFDRRRDAAVAGVPGDVGDVQGADDEATS